MSNKTLAEQQRELWLQWKTTGKEEYKRQLLNSLRPLIIRQLEPYAQSPIARNVLLTRAMNMAAKSFDTYNPTKGAAVGTYITNQLLPMRGWVQEHQNITYLPRYLADQYGRMDAARQKLRASLGHDPTHLVLAKELKLPEEHVRRIDLGMAPEMLLSDAIEEAEAVPIADQWRRAQEDRMAYLRAELKGTERDAFDLISGYGGKTPIESKQEVAQQLGMPVPELYSMTRRWSRRLR